MEEVIDDFESHRVDHKGMNVSRDERGIKTGFWGIQSLEFGQVRRHHERRVGNETENCRIILRWGTFTL